uniref:Cytochrome P450 n=1 Tax=Leptobrachium leishanense TaxID=445787 RepID=A0A8C5PZ13_9ANUR
MLQGKAILWTPFSLFQNGDRWLRGAGSRTMAFFMILSLLLLVLVTGNVLLSYWKQKKLAKLLPPGPPPLPLLGNLTCFDRVSACKHYPKLHQKYGPVFTVWKMTKPIVVLCGYETVKDALVNHGEHFSERPPLPTADINGKGYALSSDSKSWRQIRRFMLSSLRNYGMGKKSMEDLVHEQLQKLFSAISEKKGKDFRPIHLLGFAIYSTMSSVIFGENLDYKDPKLYDLVTATRKYIHSINLPLYQICNAFPVLLKVPFIRNLVINVVDDVHLIVRTYADAHKASIDITSPRDLLDTWIMKLKEEESKPGAPFDEKSIAIHVGGLLAAGTDTTSSSLTFCLVMMSHVPDIQERVQREIDEVVGHDRVPGMKDRPQLPYTNAVIHECQRTLDLAPIALYHAATEDIQFRGFLIPKGTTIIPFLTSVLSDPAHWKNPEEFDPDNFLDDEGQFKPNPAFLPFSAGPRVCLGENLARMELFLMFSALLQKFAFRKPAGAKDLDLKYMQSNKMAFLVSSQLCAIPRSAPPFSA